MQSGLFYEKIKKEIQNVVAMAPKRSLPAICTNCTMIENVANGFSIIRYNNRAVERV
jgi:hypothetical protein